MMKSQEESPSSSGDAEKGIAVSAGIVALGTFTSRILGFVRDMVLANIFGASLVADAFYVAFRIPNLLRELFAEGSMSAGFIPVFTEYLTNKGKEAARELARSAFTVLVLALAVIVLVGILFSPQIISAIAPGFLGDLQRFELTTGLTRVMFPFLFFISLAALAMGILNSLRLFAPPAFSSASFNVVNIGVLIGLTPLLDEPVYAAAIAVTLGGVAQFLIQVPTLYREGFALSFKRPFLPLHPGVVQMGKLILPTTIGLSVTQVNILVNTLLASFLPIGSISYLYYGMRLIHFPLGIFAIALATALLPTLSAQASRGDTEALRKSFSFGLRLVFFIIFPAMLGLILFRVPIVHLLFERGEFDHLATQGTADAVLFYALGLWAFAGVRIVVPVFYAFQDTKTPVKIAIMAMLLNVVLNLLLMGPLKHRGLALATSISAIFNFLFLILILKRRIGRIDGKRIIISHLKVVFASLPMLIPFLWLSRQVIWASGGNSGLKMLSLSLAIVVSMLMYAILQIILKSEEALFIARLLKERLRRRSGPIA
ncbi:MAG: murein biosynthesis integral membrane protein MurJ [Nitrospira sp.]|nr:murein biosynthesis integral membrane protein MurJ [Candidatus Manganitrophaceae bacterium]HIL35843.1 murein biosynthesis integral membrane protein MurJ [Candidatus Manganitrophaceae bacterium]